LGKPVLFDVRPSGNGGRPGRAGEHSHQGNDHDADQGVLPVDRRAWVLQLGEMGDDLVQTGSLYVGHGWFSVSPVTGCPTENNLRTTSRWRKSPQLASPTQKYALAVRRLRSMWIIDF